uniref:Uncharacterized protein n=1 Tax=Magnetospirillum gryphiswaldense TaxID=55518 RepID=A4TVU5_9PROT|nr:hypothetical protein MGR_0840 [Magnetospirillum gryphiswaldense MSR-1]
MAASQTLCLAGIISHRRQSRHRIQPCPLSACPSARGAPAGTNVLLGVTGPGKVANLVSKNMGGPEAGSLAPAIYLPQIPNS